MKPKCSKCEHYIEEHTFSEDYCGCDISGCNCDLYLSQHIASLTTRLQEAEAVIEDAKKIMTFIAYEDMQILENGYEAEEMATKWLDTLALLAEGGTN